jgi:type II secretory pathway component PulJ
VDDQLSNVLKSLRERGQRIRHRGDRGTTLVEVVVAMMIMTICGAIFTGAVVTLYGVTNRAQAVTNSSTQTNVAYQALDKMVRYAAAVSSPGFGAGVGTARYWYVELRDTTSGSEVCSQLRLNTSNQQLQRRTWTASSLSTTLTSWVQISSGITNGAAASGSTDQPFVLPASAPTASHQQLRFTLVATAGPLSSLATSRTSVVITALNSTVPPPTGPICQEAGRP